MWTPVVNPDISNWEILNSTMEYGEGLYGEGLYGGSNVWTLDTGSSTSWRGL